MTPPTTASSQTRKGRATIPVLDPRPAPGAQPERAKDQAGPAMPSAQPDLGSCSVCDEDLSLQGFPYRIVLRCTHEDV